MSYKKGLHSASFWLIIFGALVLGVYGVTGVDVIDYLFIDSFPVAAYAIDIFIGIAGVYQLVIYFSSKK